MSLKLLTSILLLLASDGVCFCGEWTCGVGRHGGDESDVLPCVEGRAQGGKSAILEAVIFEIAVWIATTPT